MDKIIHGASGLGDTVYMYPIAERFIEQGYDVTVLTNYPEVLKELNCKKEPFNRSRQNAINCSYVNRKHIPETDQYIDCCIAAGIDSNIPALSMKWTPADKKYDNYAVVIAPTVPFGQAYRDDYLHIMPNVKEIDRYCREIAQDMLIVMVGKNYISKVYCDHDLTGQTSLCEYIDLLYHSNLIISQVGNALSFAEALNKKATIFFPAKAKESNLPFIQQITPDKVIHKKSLIRSILC
jgi:hypothetical protein